ncbi:hypothetical protein BLNAU_10885 [Blattamonas nauphoetae]|uniref:Uncharacterized protein n=1 Tax=Blattamonas nauphoetae TaxID=2049346 RepID=A0ABQ9XRE8_9EUKA|nr:hypothetical protein BLNAU_10885 [Blattamonas nauphoetae]
MEWFVETVIGTELFRNEHPSAPPLTFENIQIDSSSTIVIDRPSISGSLSSDISTLCEFFLDIHRTIQQHNRLLLPLNPEHEHILFSHIMIALIDHFVASGDLILPNSSPSDLSFSFMLIYFVLPDHSFLNGNDVEYSEELRDAVKKIKETYSMETVKNAHYDWKEWVTMIETIGKDASLGSDLSFLQSRCLRATLLSLQTKHQLRANPLNIEETNEIESSSNEMRTDITRLPFAPDVSLNWMDVGSSQLSTSVSTQISLPSHQSSSETLSFTSDQLVHHSASIAHHSRQILSAIHLHLTRPSPSSFPWDIRPSDLTFSEEDPFERVVTQFFGLNDKFDISLFDETDDAKVVASLRRCRTVLETTHSTECIVDVHTFRTFLVSGLNSSNSDIVFECAFLFQSIGRLLPIADDPRDSKFQSLRKAFRDGTDWEKLILLNLWERWLFAKPGARHGQMMAESDFDFDGFLAADLSNPELFDYACVFVDAIIKSNAVSMSVRWTMDFLLSFEKRHQMMSRLTYDPSPSSKLEPPTHLSTHLAINLGSFLSIHRGYDFPSALTDLVTTNLDFNRPKLSPPINSFFFLSHTSIAPKHRHSFFPMDLKFERVLRDEPDAFFERWADRDRYTPRKFIFTPHVGLHSLLLRSPTLNLTQSRLYHFINMLCAHPSQQDTTQDDIDNLFQHFPPPRLFDTFLASPPLIRSTIHNWILFLAVFTGFGDSSSPFGACASLAKVFKMLSPFDLDPEQNELDLLKIVGETVVTLHWLSIPSHFDSPLLCHLPSLAGVQRGVLQTLSSHSGIPSLTIPLTRKTFDNQIGYFDSQDDTIHTHICVLSLHGRYCAAEDFRSSQNSTNLFEFVTSCLMCELPALVSATFEFFHRFVSVSSDAVRIELVKQGLLDHIVFAVWNSSFLDDYEKGIAVIGILLSTIRRVELKRRMRVFDFLLSSDSFTSVKRQKQ